MKDNLAPRSVSLYDEIPFWSAAFGLELLNHIPFGRRLKILDVGCGTGFPTIEIAERACRSCTVHGLDPWEAAIERANEKMKAWNINNLEFHVGRAEEMPFKAKSFDLVVSNNGLNNTQDPLQAIKECHRVSRPDGTLLFTANMPETMFEFYDVFRAVLTEMKKKKELNALEEHIHEKRMSMLEWESLLNLAGYRLSGLWENDFKYRVSNATTLLEHHFIRLAFLPHWHKIIKKQSDRDLIFGEIENRLNEVAIKNHGLTMSVPLACFEAKKK
ncbi:MAG: class I SAM-dependent methyltransferase [Bacteroidota bacterium]